MNLNDPAHNHPARNYPERDPAGQQPANADRSPRYPALELVHDSTRARSPGLSVSDAKEPPIDRPATACDTLGERLVQVGWRASDSHHELVRLAAEFAGTSEWVRDGCSSASQWVGERLDVSLRTAQEWIAVGRALRTLPQLDQALDQRRLSYAKVRILVRAATPATERELIDLACSVSAGSLGASVAAWSRRHEPEDVRDERHRESRSLSWRIEPDGLATGTLRLPADVAGGVMALVDAAVVRRRQDAADRDRDLDGDPDLHPGGHAEARAPYPTLAQQRADALVDVLSGGGAQLNAEVILHVRGDGASMDDGTPVSQHAVMRSLSHAWLRALIHDAEGTPLNASGRRRHPTARQKRVVSERDRRCVDCGSVELLEYDHVPDYSISNRTTVEGLSLRCAACHRARHARAGTPGPSIRTGPPTRKSAP